jgi:hypothetical protein
MSVTIHTCKLHQHSHAYRVCVACHHQYCPQYWTACPKCDGGTVRSTTASAMAPGFKAMATRMQNAEDSFIETIMAKGFTADEARKAMGIMLKLKVAKLDAVNGRIGVTHGMYLETDVIRNAVNMAY